MSLLVIEDALSTLTPAKREKSLSNLAANSSIYVEAAIFFLLLLWALSSIVSKLLTSKTFHYAHVFLLYILLLGSTLGTLIGLLLLPLCC